MIKKLIANVIKNDSFSPFQWRGGQDVSSPCGYDPPPGHVTGTAAAEEALHMPQNSHTESVQSKAPCN